MLTNLFLGQTAEEKNFIEDLFSCYLYTGNGSTQTITNGIDLAGKGGLVWIKDRTNAGATDPNHYLTSSDTSFTKTLQSNTASAAINYSALQSVSNTGFVDKAGWPSGNPMVSWTFRKAPKFFDCVTWSGDNTTSRLLNHSLGVLPGLIIVKRTSGTGNWYVVCRFNNTLYGYGDTNTGIAQFTLNSTGYVQVTAAFSTTATISTVNIAKIVDDHTNNTGTYPTGFNHLETNASGSTYVAYLFAHDTTADGVIQCGSYTGNGSAIGPTITLGWEPQFLLVKGATETGGSNWLMFDNMRGLPVSGNGQQLIANSSGAEGSADRFSVTATGFNPINNYTQSNSSGQTYIYLAIRRGPMRVPTDATKVFKPQIATTDYNTTTPLTGMNPGTDVWWNARRTPGSGFYNLDRLRNWAYLQSSNTNAENSLPTWSQQTQTSLLPSASWWTSSVSQVSYFFNRAPGFMDCLCYTGTGSNTTQAHNLGVTPELMIIKRRNVATASAVYSSSLANTEYLVVSTTAAKATGAAYWNSTTPTSSVFSIGTSTSVNASGGTYFAYLFATCPGVSKVGSYTGYPSQTIDCGFTNGARFVLIKRTDSTGDWYVWDTARGIVAANDPYLLLNGTTAEVTNTDYIDPVSSGFSISSTAPDAINKVAGISWSTASVAGGVFQPNAVGYGNGLYLAGGSNGTLYTSTNATTWTSRTSGFGTTRIFGIAYGNGTYVAVGLSGKIASSTDGITWTIRTSGFDTSGIIEVIFVNGIFVAVGNAGKIATSSDGITWTLRNSATHQFYSVTYGDGLFVAVDQAGQTWTSTDAITWSISATGLNNLYSVAYGNGLFVAGGLNGSIYTSPNAITWTSRTSGFGTTTVTNIAFGNGLFVAIGDGDGVTAGPLQTSTDGITWTLRGQSILFPTGVIFAENTFRCFGYDASGNAQTANSNAGQYIYLAIA